MCVVEQKTYHQPDGSQKAIDRVQRCDKAISSGVWRCSNVDQTTGKARIVEVRPETIISSSMEQVKNVTENNGHTRTYRNVVRRTGRKHETNPSKDLDDFGTLENPLQKSPSLENLGPSRQRHIIRARSPKSAPAWMGPPHPLPPEVRIDSNGTAVYYLPPVPNIPRASESERRTNRNSTTGESVSPGLSRLPSLRHKGLDFAQDQKIPAWAADAEHEARRSARETARRQRALDEAILRRQEELEAAENRQLGREAEFAQYRSSFGTLRNLPEILQPPRNSMDIEHASWSRHASTPPARARPVQVGTLFASSAPLFSQDTDMHRNYGHAAVHEHNFPDPPAITTHQPSDLIHHRTLGMIERERAKADTENHKSHELFFDEIKDAVNRKESYYIPEAPARTGYLRRQRKLQRLRHLENRHPSSKELGDQSKTAPVSPQGFEAPMMSTTTYPLLADELDANDSKIARPSDSFETQQRQDLVTQQSQAPIEQPVAVAQESDGQMKQDLAPTQLSMLQLQRRGGSTTEPQASDASAQQSLQAQLEHSHPIQDKQAVSIEHTEEALSSRTIIASAAQGGPDHSVVNAEPDASKGDLSTEQALAVSLDACLSNTGPTHEQEVHDVDLSQELEDDAIADNQKQSTIALPSEATVDARARQVIISEQYDDDNNSVYAESIFSQRSLASTMTSFSGHVNTNCTIEMIDRVISSLFSDDGLRNINAAATNDPAIGPERYRRNVRRMIKTFGLELRAEAGNAIQMRTAVAMQSRSVSTHVAREIVTRAGGTRSNLEPPNNDQQSDASVDSADEDEEASIEGLEDEGKLRSFILGSNACLHFKASLLEFVHKPYEARVLSALVSSTFTTELHRDKIFLARVARELSWVPTNLLSISHDRSLGFSDHIKGFVEDTMNESWNWSPLEERRHRLQAGYYRLSWKSPDGRTQHIDLPEHVESAVQEAFDSAPAFITQAGSCNTNIIAANNTSTAGAANNSGPALPLPSYQDGGRISSTSTAGPQLPMPPHSSQSPTASLGLQPHGSGMQDPHLNHYLYLCVEGGSRQFIGIDCTSIRTDVSFFNRIKSEYDSARGWLRLYFSTWVYDHCEFFQFQKTGIGLGARLKIAFPEPTDKLYDYLPKPLEELQLPPHGPISRDEFHLHYYYQVCPSLMSWERWHRRITGLSRIEKEAFEAAPKRVIKLDMQNGKREHFYGLYAKEARSALRVAIHMSLCCLPGVIFFFLWLFRWGHGDDLQGASVPVQLSLTLVAGYLGVLFWTR